MRRRDVLAGAGALGTAALAGCMSSALDSGDSVAVQGSSLEERKSQLLKVIDEERPETEVSRAFVFGEGIILDCSGVGRAALDRARDEIGLETAGIAASPEQPGYVIVVWRADA